MKTFVNKVCAPLFKDLRRVRSIRWQRILERFSVIISHLNKMVMIIFGRYSREYCVGAYLIGKKILRLSKTMGLLGTMLYLKQCSTSLMVAYGGDKPLSHALSVSVSLTGSGYPRIIPSFHRKMIIRKDEKADLLVQFYLSCFAISRVVEIARPIDKSTFRSIIEPVSDRESVSDLMSGLRDQIRRLWSRYLPDIRELPLKQGFSWRPVWSSLPNLTLWRQMASLSFKAKALSFNPSGVVSPFPVLPYELAAYGSLLQKIHSTEEFWSSGSLWPHRIRYPFDRNNKIWTGTDLDVFELTIGPLLPVRDHFPLIKDRISFGRLSQVVQGGGKRRIFAIGNYVNQRLLKPVHDWLMQALRMIPMDGTFNQMAPLDRLRGCENCFSFDLTAATDRWPLVVLFEVMRSLFDHNFAGAVVNTTLAYNIFDVPFIKSRRTIAFIAGQPLGYYSSWPLFALSHHVMMWYAAEQCYPGHHFTSYAILGDDVVITDETVARKYEELVKRLGVGISHAKSLISRTGCGEFAKRFRVKGLKIDISPISSRMLLSSSHPTGVLALSTKYSLDLRRSMRVGGAGYRQMGVMRHTSSKHWLRTILKLSFASWNMTLSHFLGRGNPLNPYLLGYIIDLLRSAMRPKQLSLTPKDVYPQEGMSDFNEYGMLRLWLSDWLKYLKWYCEVISDPGVQLETFFDAPIVQTSWKVNSEEPEWVRFGLLWKMYDKIAVLGLDWKRFALSPTISQPGGWILSVYDNTEIRVVSFDSDQSGDIIYRPKP